METAKTSTHATPIFQLKPQHFTQLTSCNKIYIIIYDMNVRLCILQSSTQSSLLRQPGPTSPAQSGEPYAVRVKVYVALAARAFDARAHRYVQGPASHRRLVVGFLYSAQAPRVWVCRLNCRSSNHALRVRTQDGTTGVLQHLQLIHTNYV